MTLQQGTDQSTGKPCFSAFACQKLRHSPRFPCASLTWGLQDPAKEVRWPRKEAGASQTEVWWGLLVGCKKDNKEAQLDSVQCPSISNWKTLLIKFSNQATQAMGNVV